MNILEFLKNGSGIHIKKKNRGKFTDYCGGKVTDECIRKAKASGNPTLVKRATFADNARHWKHSKGGAFRKNVNVLDSNPKIYKHEKKRFPMKHQYGGEVINQSPIVTAVENMRNNAYLWQQQKLQQEQFEAQQKVDKINRDSQIMNRFLGLAETGLNYGLQKYGQNALQKNGLPSQQINIKPIPSVALSSPSFIAPDKLNFKLS